MADDCAFCSILAGGVLAHFVLETPDVVAFLDHRPLFPGHTLVMPREHIPTLRDLPGPLRDELFAHTQAVAAAVQDAMGARRVRSWP
jgi:histidine triad (HIT) family protein